MSTTGTPYCRKPHTRNRKKCDTDNSWLANLFLSTTDHYYTTHSSPIISYRFPLPLFLEYMLIYPHCSSDHWTPYYVRIYLGSSEVTGTNGWIDPTNCLQGQASRLTVRRSVDKVQCISFEIGYSLIKDSKKCSPYRTNLCKLNDLFYILRFLSVFRELELTLLLAPSSSLYVRIHHLRCKNHITRVQAPPGLSASMKKLQIINLMRYKALSRRDSILQHCENLIDSSPSYSLVVFCQLQCPCSTGYSHSCLPCR